MSSLYRAYGLTIELPFECPLLIEAPPEARPDVVAEYGRVPRELPVPSGQTNFWQASAGRLLLRSEWGAARFLLEDGRRVVIERYPEGDPYMVMFQFLGLVLAALLRQRGVLVLHGMSAATPAGAICVAGDSGAGKSTTLCSLLTRGCRMLSDDVTALDVGPDGSVRVLPGVPRMHLSREAAERMGRDLTGLREHPIRPDKAAVPMHVELLDQPVTLAAVCLLEKHDADEVGVRRLRGREKFAAFRACLYGHVYPDEVDLHGPLLLELAQRVEVYRVQRPDFRWSCGELTEALLSLV